MKSFNIGAKNFDGRKSYGDAIADNFYSNTARLNEIENKRNILQTLRTANPNSEEYNKANDFFSSRTGKEWGNLSRQDQQRYLHNAELAKIKANKAMDASQKQFNNATLSNPSK